MGLIDLTPKQFLTGNIILCNLNEKERKIFSFQGDYKQNMEYYNFKLLKYLLFLEITCYMDKVNTC